MPQELDLGTGVTIDAADVALSQKFLVAVLLGVAICEEFSLEPVHNFHFKANLDVCILQLLAARADMSLFPPLLGLRAKTSLASS